MGPGTTKLSLQVLTNKWMWSTCTALGAIVLLVSGLEATNQILKAWSSHGTCLPELWTNTSLNGSPDIPKIGELLEHFRDLKCQVIKNLYIVWEGRIILQQTKLTRLIVLLITIDQTGFGNGDLHNLNHLMFKYNFRSKCEVYKFNCDR